MQSETWNQARELFERVLDTPPCDREAYLAAACGGDATLLAEVRALLAAHEGDSFLESPPAHVATAAARAVDGPPSTGTEATADLGVTRQDRVRTGETGRTSGAVSLPQTIGRYRIVGALGRGGMGVVYRGQDPETGELVAIKTVRAASESLVSGIRREVHALARLSHPGIVRVVDEGLEGGVPWYAMELVEGTSLGAHRGPGTRRLAETVVVLDDAGAVATPSTAGPGAAPAPDLGAVLGLVRRVCETLAFLHGEGIVHRDLKPDNVLVRPSGLPVLVDFGIATVFAGREGREVLDTLSDAGGTVAYMSPEQIRGEAVDARADLYALGCVLYELVAGRPPFVGETVGDVVRAHLTAAPAPPSVFAPGLPEALDALVVRLLAKRPAERIGYASDVAAALGRLGAEGGTEPDGPGPDGPRRRTYLYRPGFAGRVEALDAFDRILERLAGGEGGVVLIGGESGVGKTRLALEVARRAERAGARVLAGECTPPGAKAGGAGSALHALRAPLERVADRCRERGRAETDALLGPRGRLLARYEPSLAGLPGQETYPEPAELAPAAARLRLFEAVAATLGALARSRPVLVLVDDLQWADELTLGAVGHLARTGDGPVLVVGTYRSEERPESLRELLDASRATRVDLGRLEESAVEAMVGGMLAIEPPRALSGFLSRQSEGNPFFVAEYLRAAVDEGLLWRDEEGDWHVAGDGEGRATEADYERLGLPRTLRALVERRLGGLGRDAAEIVSAAAVVGREAEAELLERIAAGLGGGALLDAIEELRRRQILEPTAGGRLRFTHDKLREAVYDAIARDERARLHGAAARALEESADADAARLADHWRAADEPERARPYYLTAAREAAARYAHAEAERLYRAFVDLSDVPTADRAQARLDLAGDVLRLQGRIDEAFEVGRAALDDARAVGRRDLEVTALKTTGVLFREGSRLDEARRMFEACIEVARDDGDRLAEATATDGLGSVALQQGRLDDAERLYRRSGEILGEIGNRNLEAVSMVNLAIVRSNLGFHDEALDLGRRALAIHREVGNRTHEGIDLTNLAATLEILGSIDEAIRTSEAALAVHRETGYRQFEGLTLSNVAKHNMLLGRPEAAEASCREAIAVLEAAGDTYFLCMAIAGYGAIRRTLGDYEGAEAYARRALELGERRGLRQKLSLYACDLAHAELAQGRPARDRLEEIEADVASRGAEPGDDLDAALPRLRRAVEAFERGEPLLHGEHPDDVPDWLRARSDARPPSSEPDG